MAIFVGVDLALATTRRPLRRLDETGSNGLPAAELVTVERSVRREVLIGADAVASPVRLPRRVVRLATVVSAGGVGMDIPVLLRRLPRATL